MTAQPADVSQPEIPTAMSFAWILRRWRQIALFSLLAAVTGFVIASLQPVLYEGVATVAVIQPRMQADARPVSVGNFTGLLQTNALVTSAISALHLAGDPYEMTPTKMLRDAIIVEEVRNSNLIRVHGRLPDRKLAAALANFIAENGITLNEKMDLQETKDFRSQLRVELDEVTARLHTAEQNLLTYRKGAQLDVVKSDADAALDERAKLLPLLLDIETEKAKLATAEREIKKQQPLLTAPRMVGADAGLRSIPLDDPAASEKSPRVDKLASNRKPTSAAETAQDAEQKDAARSAPPTNPLDLTNPFVNPVYQVLDYQIALSRTRLAALEQRRRELLNVHHMGGKDLDALSTLYPREIQLRRLEAEHEIAKTMYSEVSLQLERTRLQIATNSAHLQVVDEAIEADEPLPRRRGLFTVLGLLSGMLIGTVVFGLRELRRH